MWQKASLKDDIKDALAAVTVFHGGAVWLLEVLFPSIPVMSAAIRWLFGGFAGHLQLAQGFVFIITYTANHEHHNLVPTILLLWELAK